MLWVKKQFVNVQFDHLPKPTTRVRSKFQVLKKFYVYRKPFPLIPAYTTTIYKCQGLSLDRAIIDLSDKVFSPGMAYVALSRVRTIEGVYFTSFDPKSIMVSDDCLRKINRLRSTFREDLALYDISEIAVTKKKGWRVLLARSPHLRLKKYWKCLNRCGKHENRSRKENLCRPLRKRVKNRESKSPTNESNPRDLPDQCKHRGQIFVSTMSTNNGRGTGALSWVYSTVDHTGAV